MKTRHLIFILLFSIAPIFAQNIPYGQNPKYKSSLNPKYNSNINPQFSSEINPKYTSRINPRFNSSLNPNYTSSINPKYTTQLNPQYNSKINPEYSTRLNPLYRSWEGKYLFNILAEPYGVLVYANPNIYLYFDLNGKWLGYFVRAKLITTYLHVMGTGQVNTYPLTPMVATTSLMKMAHGQKTMLNNNQYTTVLTILEQGT